MVRTAGWRLRSRWEPIAHAPCAHPVAATPVTAHSRDAYATAAAGRVNQSTLHHLAQPSCVLAPMPGAE